MTIGVIDNSCITIIYEQRSCGIEFIHFKERTEELSQDYLHKNKVGESVDYT